MVPANLAHDHFVPQDEPAFAPGRSLAAVAVSIGTNAWNSVWFSGHFSVSIAAVRLQPIPWRAYLTGLVRAPLMFLSVVLVALPFDLIGLLPVRALPGEMPWAFDALGSVLMIYLVARTCLWAPLLVEGRRPFFECLKESWMTTRGAVTRLVLLGTILVIATLPIAFVEASLSNHWHVTLAVISAHFVMAVATVYTFAYPQPATGEAPVIESSSLEP
jgi:hypothetical protein